MRAGVRAAAAQARPRAGVGMLLAAALVGVGKSGRSSLAQYPLTRYVAMAWTANVYWRAPDCNVY